MKPYKRKPGEFEIRILPDGRVLIPAPDEKLLEVSRVLNQAGEKSRRAGKERSNGRAKTSRAKQKHR